MNLTTVANYIYEHPYIFISMILVIILLFLYFYRSPVEKQSDKKNVTDEEYDNLISSIREKQSKDRY